MTTVTLAEAKDGLPALLARVAGGETIVLTDGGRWVGRLAPPPPAPPTAAEEAAREARAQAAVAELTRRMIRAGVDIPAGHPLRRLVEGAA